MNENEKTPLISVVMPAYNAEKYIKEAVDSVLNQTFNDFELIIVDDGSKDKTEEIIKGYYDHRIKYIKQENSGASAARNNGIQNSGGKYIAFIDSDDIWLPNKLTKQLNKFIQNPDIGLVYCWVQSIYPDGKEKFVSRPDNEGWVYEDLLLKNFQHNGSMQMIKKECLTKVGVFDTRMKHSQDYDLWIRLARYYKFGVVKDILMKYRVLPNSLSKNHKNLIRDHFAIIERELKLGDKNTRKLRNRIYSEYYLYLFRTCYSVINDKFFAQKYLFLSFMYDPATILKEISLRKLISYFKFMFANTFSSNKCVD